MSFASIVSGIFKPLTKIFDDLHFSKEEKAKIQLQLTALKLQYEQKALEYDSQLIKEKASIVRAEAGGQSWLQRNWRPIIMLCFGFIVFNNYAIAPYARAFGLDLPTLPLPAELLNLLTVGIGGYVVGRSVEKVFKEKNTPKV